MISIDSLSPQPYKDKFLLDIPEVDDLTALDSMNFIFGASPPSQEYSDDLAFLNWDSHNMDFDRNAHEFSKWLSSSPKKEYGITASPVKLGFNILDDYFATKSFADEPIIDSVFVEKLSAPQSPDSGFGQEILNNSFDEYADVFSLIDQDKDLEGVEPLKFGTEQDINTFLSLVAKTEAGDKDIDIEDEIYASEVPFVNLAQIIESDILSAKKIESLSEKSFSGFTRSRNDSDASDHWLSESALKSVPEEDLCPVPEGLVLQPVKQENIQLKIKEEPTECLFVLKNNSRTIEVEHSYYKKPCVVVESDEEEDVPVKKRKRNEIDEDFSPYQKPKRKAGRPRTNFSKVDTQKSQRFKMQKTKSSKRTSQASKKLKNCTTVPHDRREQHNQAERERRDMLKKNLDIVEDATPDHVLQLTQIALQSEKTNKSDEFENNENNFTVDVLKKLDELIKKEPVSHKPKYKKASRNSKMVVLLGSTYYIGSLEKELKVKESRLAQLKKQYEEHLKRLNPTKVSKKVRRNY